MDQWMNGSMDGVIEGIVGYNVGLLVGRTVSIDGLHVGGLDE